MLIIPAIDILDGKIVRLRKGDFDQVSGYDISPLDQAGIYSDAGFDWLHIVDLSGSKNGKFTALEILSSIKESTGIKIQFGGGIRSSKDAETLIDIGIDRIVLGSISVTDKQEFFKILSAVDVSKICIAADVKEEHIMIKGWKENSNINLFAHLQFCYCNDIKHFLVTDIEKDGMLTGPNFSLYDSVQEKYPEINIIVSGGVSGMDDIRQIARKKYYGVVVGKAIYEKKLSIKELSEFVK